MIIYKGSVHPYPLIRSGGLFLLIIGVGSISALYMGDNGIIDREIFVISFLMAMTSLIFAKPLSFGRPRPLHYFSLLASIILEIVLFLIVKEFLPSGLDVGFLWRIGFLIVGIHFLPMTLCFGRGMFFLGVLCIVNSILGLLLWNTFSFTTFVLIDGLLKFAFGLSLLFNTSHRFNFKSEL